MTLSLSVRAERYAAIERRLFEVLGGWVPTVAEPEVKVLLRTHSFRHAWHAELWDGLGAGPSGGLDPGVAPVFDALGNLTDTAERLAGAYGVVLPELVAVYEREWEHANPASGGPLRRAVGLMLADDREALAEGRGLLGSGVAGSGLEAVRAAVGSLRYREVHGGDSAD